RRRVRAAARRQRAGPACADTAPAPAGAAARRRRRVQRPPGRLVRRRRSPLPQPTLARPAAARAVHTRRQAAAPRVGRRAPAPHPRLRDGRADAGSPGVDVQLTHPVWAASNISNATGNPTLDRVITGICSLFAQPAAQAALTTLYAATRPLPPCSYTGPDAMRHLRGMPTLIGRSAEASDPEVAERLWALAERETG